MTDPRPLSEIVKISAEDLKTKLTKGGKDASTQAGLALLDEAASFGLTLKPYLQMAVGREEDKASGLDGYEQTLFHLNLPVRNDFQNGVSLQAASETFQMHPGTRALFPEVIDDVLKFASRQDNIETTDGMVANTRTTSGTQVLSTVMDDDKNERDTFVIAEMSNIPVRTVKASSKTVTFYKHGSGIRTTYEFTRRASLDLLVPFANRIGRELEISKVAVATQTLVNGDGVNGAAPVVNQSSFNTVVGTAAVDGQINWTHLLYWLMDRAKKGVPVDTLLMNWDAYFQWTLMFSSQLPNTNGVRAIDNLAAAGVDAQRNPNGLAALLKITPVLSTSMAAGTILGYSKGDTLEEMIEAGSDIQETERAIRNQTISYFKTQNSGYRLVFTDTRSIFKFKEA